MEPNRKKTASGKKMRVATAFTGAVALAAAFTPAAVADTGHPDVVVSSVHLNKKCPHASSVHVATSTGGTSPNATSFCFSAGGLHGLSVPYSFPGTGNYFAGCGGSYYGSYSGISHSGNGAHFKDTFHPGKTPWAFPHNGPVKDFTVHITGRYFGTTAEKC